MPRIERIEMNTATGKAAEFLEEFEPAEPDESPSAGKCRMSTYLAWAAATGAAGRERCATAV